MNFGIPKKYIYISLAFFAFNMFVAATTYIPEPDHNVFYKIGYITFPFWAAVMAGSLVGFLVLMFPTKQEFSKEIKYTRSKIVGILIVNMVFVILYLYKAYTYYLLPH